MVSANLLAGHPGPSMHPTSMRTRDAACNPQHQSRGAAYVDPAEGERNLLKRFAYHLREQARLMQHTLPEDLEQYRTLGILFDMIAIAEEVQKIGLPQRGVVMVGYWILVFR